MTTEERLREAAATLRRVMWPVVDVIYLFSTDPDR